jgi:hypothetical protein
MPNGKFENFPTPPAEEKKKEEIGPEEEIEEKISEKEKVEAEEVSGEKPEKEIEPGEKNEKSQKEVNEIGKTEELKDSGDLTKEDLSKLSEKDREIAEKLCEKLEKITSFEPSEDIVEDFNEILDLTERANLYKKVDHNVPPEVILACLSSIRDNWQEIIKDPKDVDSENVAKRLFYLDIPQAEIEMVNKVINHYLDKLSSDKKSENETIERKGAEKSETHEEKLPENVEKYLDRLGENEAMGNPPEVNALMEEELRILKERGMIEMYKESGVEYVSVTNEGHEYIDTYLRKQEDAEEKEK